MKNPYVMSPTDFAQCARTIAEIHMSEWIKMSDRAFSLTRDDRRKLRNQRKAQRKRWAE